MTHRDSSVVKYLGVIITALVILAGIVSSFAVTTERVKTNEYRIESIIQKMETLEKYNTDEHKLILQNLSEIKGIIQSENKRGR